MVPPLQGWGKISFLVTSVVQYPILKKLCVLGELRERLFFLRSLCGGNSSLRRQAGPLALHKNQNFHPRSPRGENQPRLTDKSFTEDVVGGGGGAVEFTDRIDLIEETADGKEGLSEEHKFRKIGRIKNQAAPVLF